MKHSERFNNAITALVKGYLNETLTKGHCCACAVGNMVAHCSNYEIIKKVRQDGSIGINWTKYDITPEWGTVFLTLDNGKQETQADRYLGEAEMQITSTGYTWRQLARIEFAFERATKISFDEYHISKAQEIDEDQLKGLYAVVDVLCEIEGITDVKKVKKFKEMFVKSN